MGFIEFEESCPCMCRFDFDSSPKNNFKHTCSWFQMRSLSSKNLAHSCAALIFFAFVEGPVRHNEIQPDNICQIIRNIKLNRKDPNTTWPLLLQTQLTKIGHRDWPTSLLDVSFESVLFGRTTKLWLAQSDSTLVMVVGPRTNVVCSVAILA